MANDFGFDWGFSFGFERGVYMAETVVTRGVLRRAIAREARMPFYRKYDDTGLKVTGTPDDSGFACTSLTQVDDYWKNGFAFISADSVAANVGVERPISGFTNSTNRVSVEYPWPDTPGASAYFEILNTFSATDIHSAINKSIREGGQVYPDIRIDDTTFCMVEDRMTYDLTNMGTFPRRILQVWVEQPGNVKFGRFSSGSGTTFSDSNNWAGDTSLFNADSDWVMGIYDGTSKGQVRRLTGGNGDSGTVTLVAAFVTQPDTTSKVAMWDGDEEDIDWYEMQALRTDTPQDPDRAYLTQLYPTLYGFRMRWLMTATPAALTADSDVTVVPQDYVMYKSLSILHDSIVGDNRFDRQMHSSLAEYYDQLAALYKREHVRRPPRRNIFHNKSRDGRGISRDDPMGWYG